MHFCLVKPAAKHLIRQANIAAAVCYKCNYLLFLQSLRTGAVFVHANKLRMKLSAGGAEGRGGRMKKAPKLHRQVFDSSELRKVSDAPPPDDPPLGIGDVCRLNSGGPPMLVVDVASHVVAASWHVDGEPVEETFTRDVVRRVPG